MKRLLYLGFAFPPGLAEKHPGINPAGHNFETQMIAALRRHFEIRSAGVLPFKICSPDAQADPSSGVAHDLFLLDKKPELFHQWRSSVRLKRQFLAWKAAKWLPDAVLVYNFSPIYNRFILWLARQRLHPQLILLLLDSANLGQRLPLFKRLRRTLIYHLISDAEMLPAFTSCIALSDGVKSHIVERGLPFLLMPGACAPERAPQVEVQSANGPIRFCYFGSLGPHAGALEMTKIFLNLSGNSELHICGYGKQASEFAELAKTAPRLKFHGLLPTPDDCLRLGQSCDVLVNPRPLSHGNENNFASKLFDYSLCGRAIIASRISGADQILGPEAFYFDPHQFTAGLTASFTAALNSSREELQRRGAAIRARVMAEYNWPRQAERIAQFILHNQGSRRTDS